MLITKIPPTVLKISIIFIFVGAVLTPVHFAMAQFGQSAPSLGFLIIGLINNVLVPVIFALAFIVFIWGIFRYFIAGAEDTESQKKGKQLIIYGLIGFVIMFSVWGLVNILTNTLQIGYSYHPPLPTL